MIVWPLFSFESEQQTTSFAMNEINDVDSFDSVDESNILLAYLGWTFSGNLKEEVRHTKEISSDAAALLDLYGDALHSTSTQGIS